MRTWSELIEHRKFHVHTQKMINYEDKVTSKEIARKAGCLVPETYYIGKTANKIPFDKFPKQYVIKPTHHASSRGIFLMNNGKNMFTKKKTTKREIVATEKRYLAKRITKSLHEWANQKIPRRILVEEYLPNLEGKFVVPTDYKCYIFHGKVCMVRVDYDRLSNKQGVDYYNRDFQLIDFDPVRVKYPRRNLQVDKPPHYDQMIELVEKMGKEFGDFIRIDMYLTSKGPYFGEFTLYPGSGKHSLFTKKTDRYMGLLWEKKELVVDEGQLPFTKEHFENVLNKFNSDSVVKMERVGIDVIPKKNSIKTKNNKARRVCSKCHRRK